MLTSRNFWFGAAAGVAAVYLFNRYSMRKASQ
jgi:hypothetical protein